MTSELQPIDVKNAFFKIKLYWDSVSETTINNCFKKAGFKKDENCNLELEDANEVEYHAVADVLSLTAMKW